MSQPDKAEAKRHFEAAASPTTWGPSKRRAVVKLEKIETEAEKQLKDQVRKQLDTSHVTLHSELGKKKTFTSPSVFDPVTVSGELTLENYQTVTQEASRVDRLRSYKLTEEEIQIKLNQDKGQLSMSAGYGSDPLVKETTLKAIDDKITKHEKSVLETTSFIGTKKLGRHEMDLEKALTQSRDKDKSKLSGMLVSDKETECAVVGEISNPIKDMLMEIEKQMHNNDVVESGSSTNESSDESETEEFCPEGSVLSNSTDCNECDELRRKNRYFVGPLFKTEYDYYEICDTCRQLKNKAFNERVVNSARDYLQEKTPRKHKRKGKKKKRKRKPANVAVSTCGDGVIEGLTAEKDCSNMDGLVVPTEAIVQYRLTAEQIREMPRFANYSPGEPHHVLYVKNLSNKVTEDDLKSLFCQFNTSGAIHYRLLVGKMRGQAFVTFTDVSTSTKALQLLHGYQYKGKPIIIQYGKKWAS